MCKMKHTRPEKNEYFLLMSKTLCKNQSDELKFCEDIHFDIYFEPNLFICAKKVFIIIICSNNGLR